MLMFILTLIVIGADRRFRDRLLVPGRDPMGLVATIVLGIVGSFIGGFLGYLILGKDIQEGALQPAGILGSIIGAVVALLVYRAATSRRAAWSAGPGVAGTEKVSNEPGSTGCLVVFGLYVLTLNTWRRDLEITELEQLILLVAFLPNTVIAERHTMRISASNSEYSTRLAP